MAGDIAANYIAMWDGTTWHALGNGLNDYVYAIAVSGGDVYVGGQFTMAGETPVGRIAKWDGSSWSALGSGLNDSVTSIAVSGSNVYVGGAFSQVGKLGGEPDSQVEYSYEHMGHIGERPERYSPYYHFKRVKCICRGGVHGDLRWEHDPYSYRQMGWSYEQLVADG